MAAPSVFVSYAADTKPLAEQLMQALENKGIEAWVDFKDLQPGRQIQQELEHAIDKAQCYLILVGPKSRASAWQDAEWRAMLAKAWTNSDKRVLPVVVGSSESPPFLRNWVSLRVDPADEPQTWTHRVVNALESLNSMTARGLDAKSKRQRIKRFFQMGAAIEGLEDRPSDESSAELAR
jgi:hypothetical protein